MPKPPPDVVVTTVRLPGEVHHRVTAAADYDRRSFNNEVIILLVEALNARMQEERADA